MAIALDTLVYARRLREAGFSDAQAEGQAARLDGRLADLERRVTVRMLAGIAAVSALAKLL